MRGRATANGERRERTQVSRDAAEEEEEEENAEMVTCGGARALGLLAFVARLTCG
jgi:acetaldehyde dehydrogenase (acetylating)